MAGPVATAWHWIPGSSQLAVDFDVAPVSTGPLAGGEITFTDELGNGWIASATTPTISGITAFFDMETSGTAPDFVGRTTSTGIGAFITDASANPATDWADAWAIPHILSVTDGPGTNQATLLWDRNVFIGATPSSNFRFNRDDGNTYTTLSVLSGDGTTTLIVQGAGTFQTGPDFTWFLDPDYFTDDDGAQNADDSGPVI